MAIVRGLLSRRETEGDKTAPACPYVRRQPTSGVGYIVGGGRGWLLGHSESEPGVLFREILFFAAIPASGVVRAARWSSIVKPMIGGSTYGHDLCYFPYLQEN